MKGPEQLPLSPWIVAGKFGGLPASVGNVAAPAAADPDLFEYGFTPFEYGNLPIWLSSSDVDGREKTRSTTPDDKHLLHSRG